MNESLVAEVLRKLEKRQCLSGIGYQDDDRNQRIRKIHQLLRDPEVDSATVLNEISSNRDIAAVTPPLEERHIKTAKDAIRDYNIYLSSIEPIHSAVLLLNAFWYLGKNADYIKADYVYVIGTNNLPRVSARITDKGSNVFLVQMSYHLVADAYGVSVAYHNVTPLSVGRWKNDLSQFFGAADIFRGMAHPANYHSFSYVLAGFAVGERLRGAVQPTQFTSQQTNSVFGFSVCLVSFLLAHEFLHGYQFEQGEGREMLEQTELVLISLINNRWPDHIIEEPSNLELIIKYKDQYLASHANEVLADFMSLMATMNVAVDFLGSKYLGIAASLMMLSIVNYINKQQYLLDHDIDVVEKLGSELWSRTILAPDVFCPLPNHPWGISRMYVLHYMFIQTRIGHDGVAPDMLNYENNCFKTIFGGVHQLVNVCTPYAFRIVGELKDYGKELTLIFGDGVPGCHSNGEANTIVVEHDPEGSVQYYKCPAEKFSRDLWVSFDPIDGG